MQTTQQHTQKDASSSGTGQLKPIIVLESPELDTEVLNVQMAQKQIEKALKQLDSLAKSNKKNLVSYRCMEEVILEGKSRE